MAKRRERSLLNFLNPSRNVLVLLALMVLVALLVIGLIIAFASQHLDPTQRWILITLFPIIFLIGLGLCTWLILRHSRQVGVSDKDEDIAWQMMLPESQRRKLNVEIKELAGVMGISSQQLGDLRSAYIVAEDLALRQIEQETKLPMMRHLTIEGAEFDGVLLNKDIVTCIEVTFLVSPHIGQEKINTMLKKIEFAGKKLAEIRPGSRLRLLLALVTQLDQTGEAKLRSTLISKFATTPVDVDIRLLDFEGLQRIFAAD
jgi:hypothetical protein